MKKINHPLVRVLQGGDLWETPLDRYRCESYTKYGRHCSNDATHRTTDTYLSVKYLCYTHAVTYIEYATYELITEDMVEDVSPY